MSPNTLGQEAEKTGGKVIYLRRQSDISVWAREGMLLFEGIYLSFSQRKSVHLLPI